MKFLEAKQMAKGDKQENKMRPGSRPDQNETTRSKPPVKKEVSDYALSANVDLNGVVGTGRGGEITLKDVKDAKTANDTAFENK